MNDRIRQDLATVLYYADVHKFNIPPLSTLYADYTEEDGYRIQQLLLKRYLDAGCTVAGKKTGGISYGLQVTGGFGPHYGYILSHKVYQDGCRISADKLLTPGVEAELTVHIAKDLDREQLSEAEILAAIDTVCPSWEIVESRILRPGKQMRDSLADNAAFGGIVMGTPVPAAVCRDQEMGLRICRNGEPLDCMTGRGSLKAVCGALQWLSEQLRLQGDCLRAGDVVLTGALTKPLLPLRAGDRYEAEFDGLGTVTVEGI